jgi:hypothetical protein
MDMLDIIERVRQLADYGQHAAMHMEDFGRDPEAIVLKFREILVILDLEEKKLNDIH